MFHRYFRGRVTSYVIEMEQQATVLLDALDARQSVASRVAPGHPPAAAPARA